MKLYINNSIQLLQRGEAENRIGSHSIVMPKTTFNKTHTLQYSC